MQSLKKAEPKRTAFDYLPRLKEYLRLNWREGGGEKKRKGTRKHKKYKKKDKSSKDRN